MKDHGLLTTLARRAGTLVLSMLALVTITAGAAPGALPNAAPQHTVGTVNCASSTCHGAVTPWNESNVLQNEYTTWSRLDKHAKAYGVLLNARSRSIVKNLGLKEPAHQAKQCLDCHANNAPPALRGERHVVSEGVGCEACHGPAEKWIKSHALEGVSHADNIAQGLFPTDRPVEQAGLCLSCHFGDEKRFVTHRMMGAGHPRLSFELDTFASIEPAHYRIDDDWRRRKGDYDSIRIWAVGQALASQQLLDALTDPQRGRDGLFPELVLFDCHACHHPMSEQKWTPRLGIGPGRIRLNDSNLLMLRAIVRVVDPANGEAFAGQIAQLHQAVAGSAEGRSADPITLARQLSASIGRYVERFAARRFDTTQLRAIFAALLEEAGRNQFSDYAGAEQAYLSISSLASSLQRQGGLKAVAQVNQSLVELRATLASEDRFRPEQFRSALLTLQRFVTPAKN